MFSLLERYLVYPTPRVEKGDWNPRWLEQEDVYFESSGGVQLHGWYAPCDGAERTILYCHGQSEHVGQMVGLVLRLQSLLSANVFVFDYRGYGQSQGVPTEQGCIADGLAAQQWLAERTEQLPEDIVVIGRSLGGGVAAAVAAERGARALVLENTFTKLTDVGDYWFKGLPARWFMREKYDSVARIADYHGPLFQTHNLEDKVVPYKLGRQLFRAAASSHKQFYTSHGGHFDVPTKAYYDRLLKFLRVVDARQRRGNRPMTIFTRARDCDAALLTSAGW